VFGEASPRRRVVVSELIHCQKVVEQMLTDGRPLAEIEDYIEDCALEQLEKAGLWMLAWAHQDPATQLRLAKETLALALSLQSTTA
jgi:hypothetical protein